MIVQPQDLLHPFFLCVPILSNSVHFVNKPAVDFTDNL